MLLLSLGYGISGLAAVVVACHVLGLIGKYVLGYDKELATEISGFVIGVVFESKEPRLVVQAVVGEETREMILKMEDVEEISNTAPADSTDADSSTTGGGT